MPSGELEHRGADELGAAAVDEAGADAGEDRGGRVSECGRSEYSTNPRDCLCPVVNGRVYHDRDTCTDLTARRLEWFGTPPVTGATGGPRPTSPGGLL